MSRKIYMIQIVIILLILLTISMVILYSVAREDYNYGQFITITEKYDSTQEYFDYHESKLDNYKNVEFDDNGVLVSKIDDEITYSPKNISYYGLVLYSEFVRTGDSHFFQLAEKQANYLVQVQDKESGGFYCEYDYEVPWIKYQLEKPWMSATVQGQAISFLSRMYCQTKNEEYKIACELALKPFLNDVKDGGIKVNFFGHAFYEEYPTEIPNYSLNGHMCSLIGLYDCYSITGNKEAKKLYDNGSQTLEFCLSYYDYKEISLCNLAFMKNERLLKYYSVDYHIRHIAQLEILNQIEDNEVFNYFINRWKTYVVEN